MVELALGILLAIGALIVAFMLWPPKPPLD